MNIKKTIINLKWLPSGLINRALFKMRGIHYGHNLKTYGTLFIRGKGNIQIGNNVRFNSCRETNPIGGDTKSILFSKDHGSIIIGNNVGISNSALVSMQSIEIENDVLIGGNCKIYDHDFHSIKFEDRMKPNDQGIKSAPIKIRHGAFIGASSIILKGVTVGEKAVIGAGSVVTKSIPDGEIWAGNPARFIRKVE